MSCLIRGQLTYIWGKVRNYAIWIWNKDFSSALIIIHISCPQVNTWIYCITWMHLESQWKTRWKSLKILDTRSKCWLILEKIMWHEYINSKLITSHANNKHLFLLKNVIHILSQFEMSKTYRKKQHKLHKVKMQSSNKTFQNQLKWYLLSRTAIKPWHNIFYYHYLGDYSPGYGENRMDV